MRTFLDIAWTGVTAVLLHPLRSVVVVACVLAVLVPYVAAIGVSRGIERDAELSIRFGADLYVSGKQFGRRTAAPLDAIPSVVNIEGVQEVTPRIVGAVTLGSEELPAVLVGIPADKLPAEVECVSGRLFREGSSPELIIGSQLARRLRLKPGDRMPPFYQSSRGDHVCKVVGVFKAGVSLWESNLILTSLDAASQIFDQPGVATDLMVRCRPGYESAVRTEIVRKISFPTRNPQRRIPAYVITRQQLDASVPAGLLHREGIFNLHFLLAVSVGILAVAVTSGLGLSERRREISILKAMGWQTDEVLLRSVVESLLLSLLGASLAIVMAFAWLRLLNGYWIASLFFFGASVRPEFPVPFLLTPAPALLSLLLSLVMVMTGSLFATWRAAIAPPGAGLRA